MRDARSTSRAAWAAIAAAALVAGCDELPFTPASLVDKPRIVAVAADPPVIDFEGASTLTALVLDPSGRDSSVDPARALDMEVRWRACDPWKLVLEPDRDCGPDDSLAIEASDGESWQAQARISVAEVLEAFPPPPDIIDQIGGMPGGVPGEPDDCPHDYDYAELPVAVEVRLGESRLVAVQRVRVTWDDVGRRAPVLGGMVLDDVVAEADQPLEFTPGAEHRVSAWMERASLDDVCVDDDPDQVAPEPVRAHVYVTAGELGERVVDIEYDADGTESAETLRWLAPGRGDATAWVVAVDTDSGVTWARFPLRAR